MMEHIGTAKCVTDVALRYQNARMPVLAEDRIQTAPACDVTLKALIGGKVVCLTSQLRVYVGHKSFQTA